MHFSTADADDDFGSDGDGSAHTAISNESDFEAEEDADYLALELVNHLPPDKATLLMKNLRAKEYAVQDLLRRNRSLLDSCRKLDEENQGFTEKIERAPVPASTEEPTTKAAAVVV